MNEKLLDALMELFALIANINDLKEKGRGVVEGFLKQNITYDTIPEYIEIFENYFEKHGGGVKKRTPVSNSVQGLVICDQINENLTQPQKLVILIRILEFINLDDTITEDEYDFVETVGLAFNFSEPEYKLIRDYVLEKDPYKLDYPEVLIIDSKDKPSSESLKHIHHENVDGNFVLLRVPSLDIYFVKYTGHEELNLNGIPMSTNLIYHFINGSSIRGGRIQNLYYSDILAHFMDELSDEKIHFKAENITYEFKGGKIGLHDVTFKEETGKLVGIMGASGAGKTTMLNVLSGISKPTYGSVTVNGIDIYDEKNKDENKGLIGLIAQDDLLFEELTVYQNLYYNAQLCLGGFSEEQIEESVTRILKSLGLYEIRDLTVGSPLNKKISGGQRKRLNVALELIREPYVLFVDEPTSGLSSRDSENIMDLLKELALKGKLVIVVIHQPSSDIFKMFDKLLILDTGGYPAYYGNPIDAIAYFKTQTNALNASNAICGECGNVNPEQIFNIIESKVVDENGQFTEERKVSPQKWNEIFRENIQIPELKSKTSENLPSTIIPTKIKQLGVFIKRDVLSKLSNSQYMTFTFTEAPLLAFILAFLVRFYDVDEGGSQTYIFSDNNNIVAYLFMSVVVALFLGMIVSAEEIIKDRKIQKREAFLNLSNTSYLFSKVLILFSISAIQTVTFVLIGNTILGIHGLNIEYWLVLFSASCFANMLGLNISQTFNSAVTIYILIPILLIPQLILSGAIVKFDKLNPAISSQTHVPLTGDIIASKWAFEALAVTQFKENDYESPLYDINKNLSHYNFRASYLYPKLRSKVDYNEKYANSTDPEIIKNVDHNIVLLSAELSKIEKEFPELSFDLNILNRESFDFKNAMSARNHLLLWRGICNKEYNKYSDLKDKELQKLSREEIVEKKRTYHNENLDDLVKNGSENSRILEHNGEYIQKIDPIYVNPSTDNALDYRAHLFAPKKNFFGTLIDTLYFNLFVLWSMTAILYFFLNIEFFSKVLRVFEVLTDKLKRNK